MKEPGVCVLCGVCVCFKNQGVLGMVKQAFNPKVLEVEASKSL